MIVVVEVPFYAVRDDSSPPGDEFGEQVLLVAARVRRASALEVAQQLLVWRFVPGVVLVSRVPLALAFDSRITLS